MQSQSLIHAWAVLTACTASSAVLAAWGVARMVLGHHAELFGLYWRLMYSSQYLNLCCLYFGLGVTWAISTRVGIIAMALVILYWVCADYGVAGGAVGWIGACSHVSSFVLIYLAMGAHLARSGGAGLWLAKLASIAHVAAFALNEVSIEMSSHEGDSFAIAPPDAAWFVLLGSHVAMAIAIGCMALVAWGCFSFARVSGGSSVSSVPA